MFTYEKVRKGAFALFMAAFAMLLLMIFRAPIPPIFGINWVTPMPFDLHLTSTYVMLGMVAAVACWYPISMAILGLTLVVGTSVLSTLASNPQPVGMYLTTIAIGGVSFLAALCCTLLWPHTARSKEPVAT